MALISACSFLSRRCAACARSAAIMRAVRGEIAAVALGPGSRDRLAGGSVACTPVPAAFRIALGPKPPSCRTSGGAALLATRTAMASASSPTGVCSTARAEAAEAAPPAIDSRAWGASRCRGAAAANAASCAEASRSRSAATANSASRAEGFSRSRGAATAGGAGDLGTACDTCASFGADSAAVPRTLILRGFFLLAMDGEGGIGCFLILYAAGFAFPARRTASPPYNAPGMGSLRTARSGARDESAHRPWRCAWRLGRTPGLSGTLWPRRIAAA
eukprot:scaffold16056_cov132-Isochrysis_galbana.AAC.3